MRDFKTPTATILAEAIKKKFEGIGLSVQLVKRISREDQDSVFILVSGPECYSHLVNIRDKYHNFFHFILLGKHTSRAIMKIGPRKQP